MAGATATYKGGIKAYWKRRGYDRLDAASAQRRPRFRTAELGAGAQPGRRRGWRLRCRGLRRRLLCALSPRRWLARLRDAYVNAMLRFASSAAVGYGAAPYCPGTDPFSQPRPLREYDEKVLVEIYRSVVAGGGVIPVAGDADRVVAALRLPATVIWPPVDEW